MTIDSSKGYAIFDQKDYKNFKLHEYKLKREEGDDVTVHVECCGVSGFCGCLDRGWLTSCFYVQTCGSDHHTIVGLMILRNGWFEI